MNLFDRVKFFLATTSKVKLIALITLTLVILAIPLTIFIASQQQDIRQRASAGVIATQPITPSRYMYINGTNPLNPNTLGPGADWSADAQVAAMCAKVGRSPCYPDIISQQPANWDTGAFPEETQLISIGNRFWVRGPFTQFGSGATLQLGRYYYINGAVTTRTFIAENGDVGPGKLWWDMPDIQWMCQQAGKNSAADCKPDIVSQTPTGWDNLPESTQILGFGNKVWVRGPFKGTNGNNPPYGRTYYIKGDNTAAVDVCTTDRAGAACPVSNLGPGATWWRADTAMQTMCKAAGLGEATCKPSILTTIPSGWDLFTEQTQLIGINNKVWLRSTIKRVGGATFRTYYNLGGGQQANPTEPGGGAHWFDVDKQIQDMCKAVYSAADGNSCQPQMIVQMPVGWDGMVNNQPRYPTQAQLISMNIAGNQKLWLRGPVFVATEQAYDANNGTALTRNPVAGEKIFIRSVQQVPATQLAPNLALLINGQSQWIGGNQEWESTGNGLAAGTYTLQLVAGCDYGQDKPSSLTGKTGPGCDNATQYFTATTLTVGAAPTNTPAPATNTPVPTATPIPARAYCPTITWNLPTELTANTPFTLEPTFTLGGIKSTQYSTLLVDGQRLAPSANNQWTLNLTPGPHTLEYTVRDNRFYAGQGFPATGASCGTTTINALACSVNIVISNNNNQPVVGSTIPVHISGIGGRPNTHRTLYEFAGNAGVTPGRKTTRPTFTNNWGGGTTTDTWTNIIAQPGQHTLQIATEAYSSNGTESSTPYFCSGTVTYNGVAAPTATPTRTPTPTATPTPITYTISGNIYDETGSSTVSYTGQATITLYKADNNGTIIPGPTRNPTITNGRYSLSGIPQGNYRLTLTMPTGYERATGYDDSFAILPLNTNLNQNFGIRQIPTPTPTRTPTPTNAPTPRIYSITGAVYVDRNNNNEFNQGEAAENVKLSLTGIGNTLTNSGGQYRFENVPYSSTAYRLTLDSSSIPSGTIIPPSTDTSLPVTLDSNKTITFRLVNAPTATTIPVPACTPTKGGYYPTATCTYSTANNGDYIIWTDAIKNKTNNPNADFNGDNVVDIRDFNLWRSRKFNFQ